MSAAQWIEAQGFQVWAGCLPPPEGLNMIRQELASRVLAFPKQKRGSC